MTMIARRILVAAVLTAAAPFALPASVVSSTAYAQVGLSFNLGNVGYGYRGGYVDRDNRYHAWQNAEQARYYRNQHNDYYLWENYDRNRHHHKHRGGKDH